MFFVIALFFVLFTSFTLNSALNFTNSTFVGNIISKYENSILFCEPNELCYIECIYDLSCNNAIINCPLTDNDCIITIHNSTTSGTNLIINGGGGNLTIDVFSSITGSTINCPEDKICNITCEC